MRARVGAGAALLGLAGGVAAAIVWVLPAWAGFTAGTMLAQGAALVIVAWTVGLSLRAIDRVDARAPFGLRVAGAALSALCAAVTVGAGLYVLYRYLAPELLAQRYEAYLASVAASGRSPQLLQAELARLARLREGYLDPLGSAAQAAAILLLAGLAVATFLLWRARAVRAGVARR